MTGFTNNMKSPFFFGVLAAAIMISIGLSSAIAAKGDLRSVHKSKKAQAPLRLTLGKADIITLPDGVSDVLVADPNIVDVQAVKTNKLYAVGLNIGDTNLIVLDAGGNVLSRLDIHVAYDLQAIQSLIESLFPNEHVKVGAIHSQVMLTGQVSNPEVASKITDLVGHYVSEVQEVDNKTVDELISNLLEVRGEQQVMLQVKIVEAERSTIKELGVEFNANDPNELATSTIFGQLPLNSTLGNDVDALRVGAGAGLALTQEPIGSARAFFDTGLDGIGILGLKLDALEQENLINILAEPNLTAVSGQQAGFLAGGEFPVPTGRDQFGNITIEFREFGVSLNFKPIVLSDDRISLQMNTEVSSLDEANSVTLADIVVPGLDIRRAETTIEIPSGGSLMIAGLLQSSTAEGLAGLPGVRNTPVIGDLLSSDSFQRAETELVVIVTGYLVEPFANKDNADYVPEQKKSELSKIFAANIRRSYSLDDDKIFANLATYGYIVD